MVELADVFRLHAPAYLEEFGSRMPPSHIRAINDIINCRTDVLGGQVYRCDSCSHLHYSYHSCKNRHCPKCQNDQASTWLEHQTALLLPVTYFLVTFTLPEELRPLARAHQRAVYSILFRASAKALRKLARDRRFLGGAIGMTGVLHTWARDLSYHPHVHYIVPGGALSTDGTWIPSNPKFLVPVKALSKLFRGIFLSTLKKAGLASSLPDDIWSKPWVVHCKPVGSGAPALKYLARYVFRVAIANQRILALQDGIVTFQTRDSDTGQMRRCRLAAKEFIRRFLQHVLPRGFVKVRSYGILSSSNRPQLRQVRALLNAPAHQPAPPSLGPAVPSQDPAPVCPRCGGPLRLIEIVRARSPTHSIP